MMKSENNIIDLTNNSDDNLSSVKVWSLNNPWMMMSLTTSVQHTTLPARGSGLRSISTTALLTLSLAMVRPPTATGHLSLTVGSTTRVSLALPIDPLVIQISATPPPQLTTWHPSQMLECTEKENLSLPDLARGISVGCRRFFWGQKRAHLSCGGSGVGSDENGSGGSSSGRTGRMKHPLPAPRVIPCLVNGSLVGAFYPILQSRQIIHNVLSTNGRQS
jgi:hypothetical protein